MRRRWLGLIERGLGFVTSSASLPSSSSKMPSSSSSRCTSACSSRLRCRRLFAPSAPSTLSAPSAPSPSPSSSSSLSSSSLLSSSSSLSSLSRPPSDAAACPVACPAACPAGTGASAAAATSLPYRLMMPAKKPLLFPIFFASSPSRNKPTTASPCASGNVASVLISWLSHSPSRMRPPRTKSSTASRTAGVSSISRSGHASLSSDTPAFCCLRARSASACSSFCRAARSFSVCPRVRWGGEGTGRM